MSQLPFDKERYFNLWISFIDGDSNAFSEIYRGSYKSLYSYGLSFKIADDQVRDVIQDLFVKLYTRPDLVKDASTLKPFLFTSMRNACINLIKAGQKHSGLDKIEEFEVIYSINESRIEDKEDQERINILVKNILGQLTTRQREIIYLRFLHQMEYEEISRIMDMSEQAARNLTYRAMDKIRKENSDLSTLLFFFVLFYCCK